MGVKTIEELIKEGVRLAGREPDVADTRPLNDLKDWLRSVALGWPWDEITNIRQATLLAGTYLLNIGGSGGTLDPGRNVFRIVFPILLSHGPNYLPDKITQQAVINTQLFPAADIPTGVPTKAGYSRFENGLLLMFDKKANQDYQLQINYQWDPATGYTIADIPWYPNDLTIKQSIAYFTARHHDGVDAPKTLKLEDELSIMLRNDKLKFGVTDSFTMKMNRKPKLT